tara:strand:- start:212 stop:1183 length:972 start_codon:yes stop_codon:yes gene_type:complete
MKKILVTGSSGFIGYHVSKKFLENDYQVIGIDSENNYYDINLKAARRNNLIKEFGQSFRYINKDLSDDDASAIVKDINPDYLVHLAAQAGVRHSLKYPHDYTKNNIVATTNLLESFKDSSKLKNFVFASTSSVYGGNIKTPFKETDKVSSPLQYYAATKRTNELMCHAYSSLYGIKTTGLRFFTVYGPWGRPDMALFIFTRNILNKKPIQVFNNGNHARDFTYVEDIAEGVFIATLDNSFNKIIPNRLFNLGNGSPVKLLDFIEHIEQKLGIKALKEYLPLQPGDVPKSHASIEEISKLGYIPKTNYKEGVDKFLDWYKDFYG